MTYFAKNKRTIVIISNAAIIANAIAFILLNAWTGLAVCIIDLFRNFYLMWDEKKHGVSKKIRRRDVVFLIVVYIAMALASIPTYEGFFSLFSVFASATYAFSIWQKSTLVYKFCGLPVGILWITYNTYIGSFFGIVLESALLVVSIIGFVLECKKTSKKKK
jgi:hypothetical protein